MREIKFRVWDIKKKIMYYFGDKECPDFMSLNGKIVYSDDNHRPDFCESERYILLQYIGPLDKNEKEIYEGDILLDDAGCIREVKWIGYGFSLYWQTEHMDYIKMRKNRTDDECWVEVIGNIYENPDLLKTNKVYV